MQDLKLLFHPKFWGYWLLLGLLWSLVQLPTALRMRVGAVLGRIVFAIAKQRRTIAQTNLQLVFPELDHKAQTKLIRKFAESIGQGLIETGMAWFWSEKRLRHISRFEGDAAAIAKIKDTHCPVILIGSHSTLMELGVRLLGIYIDSAGMYRPYSNTFFHHWIKYQHLKSATELVNFKDMRHVLKVLKNGGNLWYALDQDMGRRTGVFAPFFGIPTCSVNILPKLSTRTKAAWIPVFIWRDGTEYVINILPEIAQEEYTDDVAVMTQVNAIYESEIRQHPEQYFWIHRRFKTRPNNDENFYN